MADVTIVPPAQIQTVAAAGGQTPQGPAQPSLPPGTLVSGTIAGKDANGNYLLKSPQGTFTLKSGTPLTYNSDVTIRIGANAAGNTSARIVSVNGEPFAQFSTPEPESTDSVSPSLLNQGQEPQASAPSAPAAAISTAAASSPSSVRAVVVSPPVSSPSGDATLSQGSTVTVRLSSPPSQPSSGGQQVQADSVAEAPSAPSATEVSTTVTAQPQQTAQAAQALPATPGIPSEPAAPAAATTSTSAAPVQTQLAPAQAVTQTPQAAPAQAQLAQSTPPQTAPQQAPAPQQSATPSVPLSAPPAPASAPSAPASALYSVYAKQSAAAPAPASPAPATTAGSTAIPAQVVTADEHGTLTLQTPLGTVAVQVSSPSGLSSFSPGAAVTLELAAGAAPAQAEASAPATLTELASSWQSLKDILSIVSSTSPAAANALLARLPQIGPDFAGSSTAFITTLLQNDARKLLGDDTMETLRQNGRADLIEKFSGEIETLSGSFSAAPQRQVSGWQMLFLPFVYQEAMQQARLYVKREPQKKDRAAGKNPPETRFVVEVDLSELGPMQMDGLVRKREQATAFDLVIRTNTAFSKGHQQEIAGIYTEAAQLTGFKGSLAFQVVRDFMVKPLEEASGSETHGITV